MGRKFLFILVMSAVVLTAALFIRNGSTFVFVSDFARPSDLAANLSLRRGTSEELLEEALRRSERAKGLYMNAGIARGAEYAALRARNDILELIDTTEANALVIDVKEVCGPDYDAQNVRTFVRDLRRKGVWTIARIVVFKDASLIDTHPEWYVTRTSPKAARDVCGVQSSGQANYFWRDNGGGYWFDPAHDGVLGYTVEFSKRIIDLGFDELQFDYIRFPSDGDMWAVEYPAYDEITPKYEIIGSFSAALRERLRAYKPDIILSADLFGFTAVDPRGGGIGQRVQDMAPHFDYISLMLYPSHYYDGFYVGSDDSRGLPAVYLDEEEVRTKPDVVVRRSLFSAQNFIDEPFGTSTARRAVLRPWLEDFFHESDMEAGRPSGIEKVRSQIDAAEDTDARGWLLWSAGGTYMGGALHKN